MSACVITCYFSLSLPLSTSHFQLRTFMSHPESLSRLIERLQKLPGIGAKSAQRLAYHVLRTPREDADLLCAAIQDVKERVTYCTVCNNITDVDPCQYCADERRERQVICVVEEPQNVAV